MRNWRAPAIDAESPGSMCRLGGHLPIKPFEKILFDDCKLRAADRIDVLISDDVEFARLKRLANDRRSFFAACIETLANKRDGFPKR
jgi:hypothetical protein